MYILGNFLEVDNQQSAVNLGYIKYGVMHLIIH